MYVTRVLQIPSHDDFIGFLFAVYQVADSRYTHTRADRPCTSLGSTEYTFEQGQSKVQAQSSETGKKVSKGFGSTYKHTATPVQRRRVLIWTET